MDAKQLYDAIGEIDDALIEESEIYLADRKQKEKKKKEYKVFVRSRAIPVSYLAACACLLLLIGIYLPGHMGRNGSMDMMVMEAESEAAMDPSFDPSAMDPSSQEIPVKSDEKSSYGIASGETFDEGIPQEEISEGLISDQFILSFMDRFYQATDTPVSEEDKGHYLGKIRKKDIECSMKDIECSMMENSFTDEEERSDRIDRNIINKEDVQNLIGCKAYQYQKTQDIIVETEDGLVLYLRQR